MTTEGYINFEGMRRKQTANDIDRESADDDDDDYVSPTPTSALPHALESGERTNRQKVAQETTGPEYLNTKGLVISSHNQEPSTVTTFKGECHAEQNDQVDGGYVNVKEKLFGKASYNPQRTSSFVLGDSGKHSKSTGNAYFDTMQLRAARIFSTSRTAHAHRETKSTPFAPSNDQATDHTSQTTFGKEVVGQTAPPPGNSCSQGQQSLNDYLQPSDTLRNRFSSEERVCQKQKQASNTASPNFVKRDLGPLFACVLLFILLISVCAGILSGYSFWKDSSSSQVDHPLQFSSLSPENSSTTNASQGRSSAVFTYPCDKFWAIPVSICIFFIIYLIKRKCTVVTLSSISLILSGFFQRCFHPSQHTLAGYWAVEI